MLSFNNKKELMNAIDTVSNVEGLDKESVKGALEKALATIFRSSFSKDTVLHVNIDNSGGYQLFREWLVVDDNEEHFSNNHHVYEDIAQEKFDESLKIGDVHLEEISDFNLEKRGFAKNAWQVFATNIKNIHKEKLKESLESKQEQLILVNIKKYNNEGYTVEYNNEIEGFLPRTNLFSSNEKLKVGNSYFVVLDEETPKYRNYNIVFTKNNKSFIENIFKREIPEVSDELIEVKSIYHKKGKKIVVAVHSGDQKIDVIGCCVGSRGVRIQAISKHFNGEKVELVPWSGDDVEFISNILGNSVDIQKLIIEENKINVVLSDESIDSVNVEDIQELLSTLLNKTIEVEGYASYLDKSSKENSIYVQHLVENMNLDEESAEYLIELGLFSIDDLFNSPVEELIELGLTNDDANSLKVVAREAINLRSDFIKSTNTNLTELDSLNDYMIDILLKSDINNISELAELSTFELIDLVPLDEDYSSNIIIEARDNCEEEELRNMA